MTKEVNTFQSISCKGDTYIRQDKQNESLRVSRREPDQKLGNFEPCLRRLAARKSPPPPCSSSCPLMTSQNSWETW